MDQYVVYNIKGIKCDHCDYKNKDVCYSDYGDWLGKPCPNCGSNLLTQEDLDATDELVSQIKEANELLSNLNMNNSKSEDLMKFNVEMNGTGSMKIEKTPE